MTLQYLIDENMPDTYCQQLLRYQPSLTVFAIGNPNVPLKGTKDPELLQWCEDNNFILVTKNRRSMPVPLRDRLSGGKHIPGIFVLRSQAKVGQIIEELILMALASEED